MCAMYCVLTIVTCGYNQTTLFTTASYWWGLACQLKTIPPRLLADLLGGMAGLVLGGQDHTPYPFGPRPTIPCPGKS